MISLFAMDIPPQILRLIFFPILLYFRYFTMKKVLLSAVLAASAGFAAHISATLPAYDAQAALVAAKADIPNWMSYLPDELYVAHVSIPGTHDTATGHEWDSSLGKSMSTTQVATIDEQLAGGIRAFDFRPGLKTNSETNEDYLVCAHGTTYLKLRHSRSFLIFSTPIQRSSS